MNHGKIISKKHHAQPKKVGEKPKWKNLGNNQCPICDRSLFNSTHNHGLSCSCGFFITEAKFKELTSNIVSGSKSMHRVARDMITPEEERQAELNNLWVPLISSVSNMVYARAVMIANSPSAWR